MVFVPPPLSTAVDSVARRVIGRDWGLWALVMEHWATIVGPEYAALTRPVKISFPGGKAPRGRQETGGGRTAARGVLHVGLPRGLVLTFTMLLPRIQERLATCLGRTAIERIALEPWAVTPADLAAGGGARRGRRTVPPVQRVLEVPEKAALDESVRSVADPSLQDALRGLGEAIRAAHPPFDESRTLGPQEGGGPQKGA